MSGFDSLLQRPTFASSENSLARFVARPVLKFMNREVASSILLLVATAVALTWANSPWKGSYEDLLQADMELSIAAWHLHLGFEHFVNDALMVLFFFVAGLEIKRELVTGELSSLRAAALPAISAAGGMVVPALLFVAFNFGGAGSGGWGIPMATDIAFAVGVVALLGSRISPKLKLFLLTLAVVDDIGAIIVIAIFYTDEMDWVWLGLAVLALVAVRALQLVKVWAVLIYVLVGLFVWYATFRSGVHATIAGVALGLLTPARPLLGERDAQAIVDCIPDDANVSEIRHAAFLVQESVPLTIRLGNLLHPFAAFLIVPLFAFTNAGLEISGSSISGAFSSKITWGVIAGLVIGKPVGITLFAWVATRFGFRLPDGMSWGQFIGMGVAAGIGFTVSIFVGGLAFDDPELADMAKIGILTASLIASAAALIILHLTSAVKSRDQSDEEPLVAAGGQEDGSD